MNTAGNPSGNTNSPAGQAVGYGISAVQATLATRGLGLVGGAASLGMATLSGLVKTGTATVLTKNNELLKAKQKAEEERKKKEKVEAKKNGGMGAFGSMRI